MKWVIALAAMVYSSMVSPAAAQELGCCQFTKYSTEGRVTTKQRQCTEVTQSECRRLVGSFFRGWGCEERAQRCERRLQPRQPTPTATASPTPTPEPVSNAPVPPGPPSEIGCCQLNLSSGAAVCDDGISRGRCLEIFDGRASFCAGCKCSGRSGPRFDFNPGTCVEAAVPAVRVKPARPARPVRPARPSRPQ